MSIFKASRLNRSADSARATTTEIGDNSLVTPAAPRQRLIIVISLLVCMLGAVLLSQFVLAKNSIRLDEAQTLWQSSHSISGTLKVVAQDVHVPLYHLIIHFWLTFVSTDIQSVRLLSLGFFLLTIPVIYLIARQVLSVNWSLLAVALFSFSPFMNWYANEARMYTLLVLVASLSQYYFLKLIASGGKRGWLGYTLSAMVGVYSHYFFIFNLLGQGIYFLIARRRFVRGTLLRFFLLALLLVAELSPWIYYFRSLGSASNTSPNLPTPSSVDLFNVFSQFSFGFQNNAVNTILVSTWPILVIVALLGVKYGQKLTPKMGYILAAGLLPITLAYVLSFLITPFFLSRYMVACVAPLIILVVWFISNYRRRLGQMVTLALVVLLVGVSLQQYRSRTTPVVENYRQAAEIVNRAATARDVVVLAAPFTVYPFDYYYAGAARVYTLPNWNRSVPGPIPAFDKNTLPEQVTQLNKNHQYTYLLLSYDQGYETDIYQYYERHFERKSIQTLSSGMRLAVYRVGYNETRPLETAIQP